MPPLRDYRPTALPPVAARLLAFLAIVVGGACGGLIAYSFTELQCGGDDRQVEAVLPGPGGQEPPPAAAPGAGSDQDCPTVAGLAGLAGAALSAGGVAVIAVLVLRAMAEWRRTLE